jgi:hypothetical protein
MRLFATLWSIWYIGLPLRLHLVSFYPPEGYVAPTSRSRPAFLVRVALMMPDDARSKPAICK